MTQYEKIEDFNPGVDKIWGSFARSQERLTPAVSEKYNLPFGFVTEKGSAYRYESDGSVRRDKYDGTRHNQDIAVFLPDDDETTGNSIGLISFHQTEGDHRERNTYILEFGDTNGVIDYSQYRKIYSTSDVVNPERLALVLLRRDGTFDAASPVSLQPVEGAYVFEMSKRPDGKTSRHPGHKVVDVIS